MVEQMKNLIRKQLEEVLRTLEHCHTADEIYCLLYGMSSVSTFMLSKVQKYVVDKEHVYNVCTQIKNARLSD